MKKLLLFSISVIFSAHLFAQSFDIANLRVGGGLYFASDINNVGLSINGVYTIAEQWEASLAFSHMFEKDYVSWNVLDLDGHYIFYQQDKFNVYGLSGLSLTFWKINIPEMSAYGVTIPSSTTTGSDIGLNLGVGANYPLTTNLNIAPEMRFTIIDGSYFRIGATLQYKF